MDNIIDPDNKISPFIRAQDFLEQIFSGEISPIIVEDVVHELQMLANIVANVVSNEIQANIDVLRENGSPSCTEDVINRSTLLLKNVNLFNAQYKKIREKFLSSLSPDKIRETYEIVEEYLSIIMQREFTQLLAEIQDFQNVIQDQIGIKVMLYFIVGLVRRICYKKVKLLRDYVIIVKLRSIK